MIGGSSRKSQGLKDCILSPSSSFNNKTLWLQTNCLTSLGLTFPMREIWWLDRYCVTTGFLWIGTTACLPRASSPVLGLFLAVLESLRRGQPASLHENSPGRTARRACTGSGKSAFSRVLLGIMWLLGWGESHSICSAKDVCCEDTPGSVRARDWKNCQVLDFISHHDGFLAVQLGRGPGGVCASL